MSAKDQKCLLLLTPLFLTGVIVAQVPHQLHHPPESTNAYIRALEDPSRAHWQKPKQVVKRLSLKPGAGSG